MGLCKLFEGWNDLTIVLSLGTPAINVRIPLKVGRRGKSFRRIVQNQSAKVERQAHGQNVVGAAGRSPLRNLHDVLLTQRGNSLPTEADAAQHFLSVLPERRGKGANRARGVRQFDGDAGVGYFSRLRVV